MAACKALFVMLLFAGGAGAEAADEVWDLSRIERKTADDSFCPKTVEARLDLAPLRPKFLVSFEGPAFTYFIWRSGIVLHSDVGAGDVLAPEPEATDPREVEMHRASTRTSLELSFSERESLSESGTVRLILPITGVDKQTPCTLQMTFSRPPGTGANRDPGWWPSVYLGFDLASLWLPQTRGDVLGTAYPQLIDSYHLNLELFPFKGSHHGFSILLGLRELPTAGAASSALPVGYDTTVLYGALGYSFRLTSDGGWQGLLDLAGGGASIFFKGNSSAGWCLYPKVSLLRQVWQGTYGGEPLAISLGLGISDLWLPGISGTKELAGHYPSVGLLLRLVQ